MRARLANDSRAETSELASGLARVHDCVGAVQAGRRFLPAPRSTQGPQVSFRVALHRTVLCSAVLHCTVRHCTECCLVCCQLVGSYHSSVCTPCHLTCTCATGSCAWCSLPGAAPTRSSWVRGGRTRVQHVVPLIPCEGDMLLSAIMHCHAWMEEQLVAWLAKRLWTLYVACHVMLCSLHCAVYQDLVLCTMSCLGAHSRNVPPIGMHRYPWTHDPIPIPMALALHTTHCTPAPPPPVQPPPCVLPPWRWRPASRGWM